jgi:hypothetical protein
MSTTREISTVRGHPRQAAAVPGDVESRTIVTGKVSGNFPNSPVTLEHIFRLDGDKIASLEIR